MNNEVHTFDCGCSFPIVGPPPLSSNFPAIKLNVNRLPLTCGRVWEILGKGLTKGVFQLESNLGRQWSKRIKSDDIEHLINLGALLRPSCLRAVSKEFGCSTTELYCRRKNGEQEVSYIHKCLEKVLKDSFGLILMQEASMDVAKLVAGFSLQEANELRIGMAKKKPELMAKMKIKFAEGVEQTGIVNEAIGKEIFDIIQESQRYSFSRNHATPYAMNTYATAYCKAHFPLQFFCSYLTFAKEKQKPFEEVRELIDEAKLMDIEVRLPDFRNLNKNFFIKGTDIFFGLTNIKGVGGSVLKKVKEKCEALAGKMGKSLDSFTSYDIVTVLMPAIGFSTGKALISAGAFDYLRVGRRKLLDQLDKVTELSPKEVAFIQKLKEADLLTSLAKCSALKKDGGGCHTAKRQKIVKGLISQLEKPSTDLSDNPTWIAGTEEALLGIPITCSRVDACDLSAVNTSCRDFIKGLSTQTCLIIGVEISASRECKIKTGKNIGKPMAHLTVNDGTASLDATCFADVWAIYKGLLSQGNTVIMQGQRDRNKGGFIVKKVFQTELVN